MSTELKLTAGNATEQRVLDYLLQNASEALAEKINAGKKTLAGAIRHATEEARTMAAGSGCVCVDDDAVFSWIIHYFEEDEIKEKAKPAVRLPNGGPDAAHRNRNAPKKAKTEKPVEPVNPDPQLSLFDSIMGAGK